MTVCFRDSTVHSFFRVCVYIDFFSLSIQYGSQDNLLCSAICCTYGALLYKSFFFPSGFLFVYWYFFSIKIYWSWSLCLWMELSRVVIGSDFERTGTVNRSRQRMTSYIKKKKKKSISDFNVIKIDKMYLMQNQNKNTTTGQIFNL